MITWSRIDELADEIGPDDFGEVVTLFLEEVEGELEGLPGLNDAPSLERALHFLKGSALNLGFSDFATLCQQGERQAAQGDIGNISATLVIDCYERSKAEFMAGLNNRHPA
ncbi:MAG: Hpt domain-containing protein [Pseudomonadota bacterium]|nr:Hpt domain-containing protein [Pseudomonadota bacterium]